jgi:hypothetical protein
MWLRWLESRCGRRFFWNSWGRVEAVSAVRSYLFLLFVCALATHASVALVIRPHSRSDTYRARVPPTGPADQYCSLTRQVELLWIRKVVRVATIPVLAGRE